MVNGIYECIICKEKNGVEESHDIPKYMCAGSNPKERKNVADRYGRHLLCKECHDTYERRILRRIFLSLFDERINLLDINRKSLIEYERRILKLTLVKKWACQKIANQVKGEFFNGK